MTRVAALVALLVAGCAQQAPPGDAPSREDVELREVAAVHGGAGPWAVLGYRMGRHALAALRLPRHSFDLTVTHESPQSVQYTCIADGAAAATGASAGKLNLTLVPAADATVITTYANKSTGQKVRLRPAKAFVARFSDVPRDGLAKAGREVLALPDAELFEAVPTP